MLPDVITVEDVVNSPVIADPLHRLDCCVISDGGGALVLVRPEIAKTLNKTLKRPSVKIIGVGEAVKHLAGGTFDLTTSGAAKAGPIAFAEAGVTPADIKYVSIYDSFTITVIMQLEDLGFCKKGEGGEFVRSGALRLDGTLPTNTSGGQLSEAHVEGMLQIVEGARQLQGIYGADRQVPDAEIALISGHGGNQVCHSTLILGRA